MKNKSIQTKFDGYKFRSRTEARWAVMFKAMGVKYEYEKEGYDLGGLRYLPDFWLPIRLNNTSNPPGSGYWLEIKGSPPTETELYLCESLVEATGHNCFLIQGYPGDSIIEWKWALNRKTNQARCVYSNYSKDLDEYFHPFFIGIEVCCADPTLDPWFDAVEKARSARFEHGETPQT